MLTRARKEALEDEPRRPRSQGVGVRLLWFAIRTAQIGVVAWLLLRWESPIVGNLFYLKDSLVVLFAVVMLGKLVFDMLFFDRFQR